MFGEQVNKTQSTMTQGWNILHTITLQPGIYEITAQLTIDPNGHNNTYFNVHIADPAISTYEEYTLGRQVTYVPTTTGIFGANVKTIVECTRERTFKEVVWVGAAFKHLASRFVYVRIK